MVELSTTCNAGIEWVFHHPVSKLTWCFDEGQEDEWYAAPHNQSATFPMPSNAAEDCWTVIPMNS